MTHIVDDGCGNTISDWCHGHTATATAVSGANDTFACT